MEQSVLNIIASGNPLAIVALIAVIAVYVVIWVQRKNTATERDIQITALTKNVDKLQNEVTQLKEYNNKLDVEKQLLQKDVDFLKQENVGIKEDLKEIKVTLNNIAISLERLSAKYSNMDD